MKYGREEVEKFQKKINRNENKVREFFSSSVLTLDSDNIGFELSISKDFDVLVKVSSNNGYEEFCLNKGQINELKTWITKVEKELK